MAILSEETWSKHANPWSGWTRVLTMPLLGVGLYFHNWPILVLTIVWAVINPIVFSKPKSVNNWMSLGVIGEQLYLRDGKKVKKDLPTLLNIINIPVFVVFVYFAWQQNLEASVLSALLVMTIKFWFIDRMVMFAQSAKAAAKTN